MILWLATSLALRDVHVPIAPSWWPPAPGWWVLLGGLCLLLGGVLWHGLRQQREKRRLAADFNQRLATADTPLAQLTCVAELLRRAALRRDPATAGLHGEAWLAWLDAGKDRGFVRGPGRLLLDGGYRRDVDRSAVEALLPLARSAWVRLRAGQGG